MKRLFSCSIFLSRTSETVRTFRNVYAKSRFLTQSRKGAKKALETRQRFASLRLCVRNILELSGVARLPGQQNSHTADSPKKHKKLKDLLALFVHCSRIGDANF